MARFERLQPPTPGLSSPVLALIEHLHERFAPAIRLAASQQAARRLRLLAGERPAFVERVPAPPQAWRVAAIPDDLADRRIELAVAAGPAASDIALCASVSSVMGWPGAAPGLQALIAGHAALSRLRQDAAARPVSTRLGDLHRRVAGLRRDGGAVSAGIVDLAIVLADDAAALIARGRSPSVVLSGVVGAEEARLWDDVIAQAERRLFLPAGSVKATVLVDTFPLLFELPAALWELRERAVAVAPSRWDLVASFIGLLGRDPRFIAPDRRCFVMGSNFLAAASSLCVATAHRHGLLALGDVIDDAETYVRDTARRLAHDVERDVLAGFDGVRIAHAAEADSARAALAARLAGPNQREHPGDGVAVLAEDLLSMHPGRRTPAGLTALARDGLRGVDAALAGAGPEAALARATLAILWQWRAHGVRLSDGRVVDAALVDSVLEAEARALRGVLSDPAGAIQHVRALVTGPEFHPDPG